MFNNAVNLFIPILLTVLIKSSTCEQEDLQALYEEAKRTAMGVYNIFHDMFSSCISSPMPDQHFLMDDLKSFVNYPSKTTVGFGPKFTSNRKFFANMIGTPEFRDMVEKDEEELRRQMIKKHIYCQEVVMNKKLLKEFYDREVDQTKI